MQVVTNFTAIPLSKDATGAREREREREGGRKGGRGRERNGAQLARSVCSIGPSGRGNAPQRSSRGAISACIYYDLAQGQERIRDRESPGGPRDRRAIVPRWRSPFANSRWEFPDVDRTWSMQRGIREFLGSERAPLRRLGEFLHHNKIFASRRGCCLYRCIQTRGCSKVPGSFFRLSRPLFFPSAGSSVSFSSARPYYPGRKRSPKTTRDECER